MKKPLAERRRFIRLEAPINVSILIPENDRVIRMVTKNISAMGLRIETNIGEWKESEILDMTLALPNTSNPVHAKGKVIWVKKLSLEDDAPFSVGVAFEKIDEDNKNTFLKYLCDLIYTISHT